MAALSKQGPVFYVHDARYLIHFSENDIQFPSHNSFALTTVFKIPEENPFKITSNWLQHNIEGYQKEDDVFQLDFLSRIVLHGAKKEDVEIGDGVDEFLKSIGTSWMRFLPSESLGPSLAPGPYALVQDRLRKVFRLQNDMNGAFLAAVEPNTTNPFVHLSTPVNKNGFLDIAVPSRLMYQPSPELPLAGLRIAVKDNFHLKGLKTSLCNRAYYETYPARSETAVCIQQLVNAGAIILGKTKLNSFGVWEEPTEYVDYQAPWNPRADGYQSPGGSSSGSGVAIGAYDWLDIAIGSDTGGSISRPALWNGCFAMRPSTGAVPTEGVVTSIKYGFPPWVNPAPRVNVRRMFDMPGFLGRDLQKFRDFANVWYAIISSLMIEKPFSKIVWATDYWDTVDSNQHVLAETFVRDIEALLDLKETKLSFKEEWSKYPPEEAGDMSLDEYFKDTPLNVFYDDYHAQDSFRKSYWQKFQKAPYVGPAVRAVWGITKNITRAERDKSAARLDVYRTWFIRNIMSTEDGHALLVLPMENMAPRYRDEPPAFQRGGPGVNSLLLAPVLEAPELVVPVGELSYISRVTQREEFLPFAVGLIGLPGSDLKLIDMALACLEKAKRPTIMHPGRSAFSRQSTKKV